MQTKNQIDIQIVEIPNKKVFQILNVEKDRNTNQ